MVLLVRSKSIVTLLAFHQSSLCVFANERNSNEVDYHKQYDHKVIMSHQKDGQRWYPNEDESKTLLANSKKNDDDDMKSERKTKKTKKTKKKDKKDKKDEKDETKKIQKQKEMKTKKNDEKKKIQQQKEKVSVKTT